MANEIYAIVFEGMDDLRQVAGLNRELNTYARQAVNYATTRARTLFQRELGKQVNFPASYLSPAGGRLAVRRKATNDDLTGSIIAKGRATSLARFAQNASPRAVRKQGGVTLAVRTGSSKVMKKAFLLRLRRGSDTTDTLYNLGLAIRLKPGETPQSKRIKAKPIFPGVFLLYGPSVYQMVESAAEEYAPVIIDDMSLEFLRLVDLRRQ